MNPANDPDADYMDDVHDLVRRGYDHCAEAYAAQRAEAGPELRWLMERLADGSRVLDIGCGAGGPVAQALAECHTVVGVDLSAAMIELARRNVPDATFLHTDVMAADFPNEHFDAAVAFYSIFHLPREEHAALFGRLARWLKPGGYLLATLTPQAEDGYTEDDFFGVTMYWSNYGLDDYVDLLAAAGFRVVTSGVVGHGYDEDADAEAERHPIVLAQKALTPPSPPSPSRLGEGGSTDNTAPSSSTAPRGEGGSTRNAAGPSTTSRGEGESTRNAASPSTAPRGEGGSTGNAAGPSTTSRGEGESTDNAVPSSSTAPRGEGGSTRNAVPSSSTAPRGDRGGVAPPLSRFLGRGGAGGGEGLWTALLCLSPTALIGGIFLLLPILFSLYLSFHRWSILDPSQPFVGLGNYQRLVSNREFWQALRNTVLYTAGTVGVGAVLSLALAVLLNRPIRGLTFYRTAYFMPVVTSTVVVAIVWTWIYNPQYGLMNDLLRRIGLPTTNWLADPRWALIGITIMGIWKTAGYNMMIFLAGLQTIPDMYYEAARIDGAGAWSRLRHITLPMLRPTTAFVVITSTIFSFQVFGPVYVMTGGGPMRSTTVIVYYLYQRAFEFREMGYASAVAWVLFLVIFSLSLLQFRYARTAVGT